MSHDEGLRPDCSLVRERVFEFLDEELPSAHLARVRAHLAACPPCEGLVRRERAFLDAVRARCAHDPCPERVRDRIRDEIRRRREGGPEDP